ncbi:hypothetical protein L3V79_08920 [Thiotrichales bacterium 19S9-12]|nr:hypothetical protein [Thiotrichales bacterium 19S9-11]MCF6812478.1 hypothetical protein [Thiotrichales bacterium 19S9-12]
MHQDDFNYKYADIVGDLENNLNSDDLKSDLKKIKLKYISTGNDNDFVTNLFEIIDKAIMIDAENKEHNKKLQLFKEQLKNINNDINKRGKISTNPEPLFEANSQEKTKKKNSSCCVIL